MPTLEQMTTLAYEHPKIGPVGVAPTGRKRSTGLDDPKPGAGREG